MTRVQLLPLEDRWQHHLSSIPQFLYVSDKEEIFSPETTLMVNCQRPNKGISEHWILRARTPPARVTAYERTKSVTI